MVKIDWVSKGALWDWNDMYKTISRKDSQTSNPSPTTTIDAVQTLKFSASLHQQKKIKESSDTGIDWRLFIGYLFEYQEST